MKIKIALITSLLLLPLWVMAETAANELAQTLSQLKSMQANFSQVVRTEEGREIQKSSGSMALSRPGKFRWDTTKPMRQLIVADGKKLWVYDPDLEQVTVSSLASEIGQSPALFLSGYDENALKSYGIKANKNRRQIIYTLTPKSDNADFRYVQLTFQGLKLTQMRLVDSLGQVTNLEFSRLRTNVDLDPGLFRFEPPAGVDVIEQ